MIPHRTVLGLYMLALFTQKTTRNKEASPLLFLSAAVDGKIDARQHANTFPLTPAPTLTPPAPWSWRW
jgi:hypothetical protein